MQDLVQYIYIILHNTLPHMWRPHKIHIQQTNKENASCEKGGQSWDIFAKLSFNTMLNYQFSKKLKLIKFRFNIHNMFFNKRNLYAT